MPILGHISFIHAKNFLCEANCFGESFWRIGCHWVGHRQESSRISSSWEGSIVMETIWSSCWSTSRSIAFSMMSIPSRSGLKFPRTLAADKCPWSRLTIRIGISIGIGMSIPNDLVIWRRHDEFVLLLLMCVLCGVVGHNECSSQRWTLTTNVLTN